MTRQLVGRALMRKDERGTETQSGPASVSLDEDNRHPATGASIGNYSFEISARWETYNTMEVE